MPDMIFEENKVKETYFDKYEGINSEISQVTRFDENTDLRHNLFRQAWSNKKKCDKSRGKVFQFQDKGIL